MEQYNQPQQKAIEHVAGPMLVLAGPGSGKTFTITRRIRHLIRECGVDPDHILVITFTNAAAREMRERFLALMEGEPGRGRVTFGTFHSIFFGILKRAYGYTGSNIIREEQRRAVILESLRRRQPELTEEEDMVQSLCGEIGQVKEGMMETEHYHSVSCGDDVFRGVLKDYERFLRENRLLDFEDMLVFTYELFREREDIRRGWSSKFQYILIDEFQDINRIQYEIIRMLARPGNHLFAVGDDDQSIYRFRGARPEIMLGFEKDYPGCRKVVLSENYRSDGAILEAAGRVIRHNKVRYPKKAETKNARGNPVEIREFAHCGLENQAVAEQILQYAGRGMKFSEMAVLVRTNTQPRSLLEKLLEYNIPFVSREKIPCLYDHWIVKDLLAYMKLAEGHMERGLFLRVMNRPNRYIRREQIREARVDWRDLLEQYEDRGWMLERIGRFQFDLQLLAGKDPYSAITYISKKIGYGEFLEEYARARGINGDDLTDILEEVRENAKPFAGWQEWELYMSEYKEQLSRQQQEQPAEGVAVSTMHGAKGLEYDAVFIIDVNEGITPYRKALVEADLEEERRMFYVAMTRARKYLHLYYARERYGKTMEPSRFLAEIRAEALKKEEKAPRRGEPYK